ncbi:hypothetical protein CC78DRAFT_169498 [Lojkania enalia]|uniref:Zn(2)-C6 fungal-type domain-containing protein n=1 Tax=Lojkania enalia TaxID=147567 RepID=A0A9P4KB04_9PLEO|nr:hypothetical protein CC78DRAFT_169498 [Didymosphaeria enalia]
MLPAPQRKGDCRACRERKVDCDKKKPRCTACIESNKPCGGYEMGQFFINVSSHGPSPVWNRSQNAQKFLVLDMASQPSGSQPLSVPPGYPSRPSSVEPMPWTPPSNPNVDSNSVTEMVTLFLDMYYRRFDPNKTPDFQPGSECGGWRALIPHWIGQSAILDAAIGAMASCFIGTQYQDENRIERSRDMYLNALQMIQKVLPEPGSERRADLLATTLVLSSTELFMSNGGGAGQITHIEGAIRLLSGAFEHGNFEELHIYILNQGLFEAICSRRRYLFSSPSYRPLIRQLYACPRNNRNDLYFRWSELILPLPNILASADHISASANSSDAAPPSAIHAILDDLVALEQSLSSWHETLKSNTLGPWTFQTAQRVLTEDGVPYPLQFTSIEVCTLHNLYWMSQLLLLETRSILISLLPPHQTPEPPSPNISAQIAEYASFICRSVQFCTSNTSFAATENIFLPLFITASHYSRIGDVERMKWSVACFRRIAKEQKIGFSIDKLNLSEGVVNRGVASISSVSDEV